MSDHVSTERMSEALDGRLSSSEMELLDLHVRACEPCRNEYARLSEIVSALRALPRSGVAPEEAWEGISARIEARGRAGGGSDDQRDEVTVVRLPVAGGSAPRRTFSLSAAQLLAAACLVAVVSASTVWVAMGIGGGETVTRVTESAGVPAGAAARAVSLEDGRYVEVVGELERILAEGRMVLAPETLVTIEESLRTVNAAIEEIETALADDPNSDLLLRMLATHRSTKLGVLQRAASAVQAQI